MTIWYGKKGVLWVSFFVLGVALIPLPLQANDPIQNQNNTEISSLPQGYKRQNIAAQIGRYRHLLHPIWQNLTHKEDLPKHHIPGLIEVIQESVAIINDLLDKSHPGGTGQKEEKGNLEKIWSIAQRLDNDKLLSLENSATIHLLLGNAIDLSRDYLRGTMRGEAEESLGKTIQLWNDALDQIEAEHLQGNGEKFSEIRSNLRVNKGSFIQAYENIGVVFILHRHPDPNAIAHISPQTFVDQYFHADYPACLALFDVVSAPTNLPGHRGASKKDPHFSVENGARKMLVHDFDHCANISTAQDSSEAWKIGNFKIFDNLYPVYQAIGYYRAAGNKNATDVLINGLFIMFHEIIPSMTFGAFDPASNSPDDFNDIKDRVDYEEHKEAVLAMINAIKKHMILSVEGQTINSGRVGSFLYKSEIRDWEYILKQGVDLNGMPFLATIPIGPNNQRRAFPAGQREGGGDPFLATKEEKHVAYLPKVPQNLKEERYNLLIPALKDGYNRFWTTFSRYFEDFMDGQQENNG